jgi:hypothetical protein
MRIPTLGLLLALACLAPATARAEGSPELSVATGTTFSVDGEPGGGGAALALGLVWPIAKGVGFGVTLRADDHGTGREELFDPNTQQSLGVTAGLHRWSWGVDWTATHRLLTSRRSRLEARVGFGYLRQEADRRGVVGDAVTGTRLSAGLGWLRPMSHGHALGASLALNRAAIRRTADPGRTTSWATAAVEWRWQGTPRE